jgi:hypothetical protein
MNSPAACRKRIDQKLRNPGGHVDGIVSLIDYRLLIEEKY